MVQFGSPPSPNRRKTVTGASRVLTLVVALVLVLVLMSEARKAKHWTWIWRLTADAGDVNAATSAEDDAPIDTRIATPEKRDLDTVRITRSVNTDSSTDRDVDEAAREAAILTPAERAAIKDDTSIRRAETPILFRLISQPNAGGASERRDYIDVGFAQLYRQPDVYRGRPVMTHGTIRRIIQRTAPANDAGITEYFEVWLQPHDNPADPVAVYCRTLPSGLSPGEDLAVSATIRGVFFKRWAYQAQDVPRAAPLLIASTVAPEVEGSVASAEGPRVAWWQVAALAAVMTLAVVVVARRATRRSATTTPATMALPPSLPEIDENTEHEWENPASGFHTS